MQLLRFLFLFLFGSSLFAAAPFTPEDAASVLELRSPRISPDGKTIVYVVSAADLEKSRYDTDLWMVPFGGGDPIRLAASSKSETSPAWSPDGSLVAFLSDREARTQVWLIRPDGGEAWQLTESEEPVIRFEWSPLGNEIAYITRNAVTTAERERLRTRNDARVVGEGRNQHLHIIDLESRESRRLTEGDFNVLHLDFAPDGETIAFSRSDGVKLDGLFDTDLHILDLETGASKPLVEREGMDATPRFSPDGESIAFITHGGELHWNRQFRLAVMSLADGEPVTVSEEHARTPGDFFWTLDGSAIIFHGSLDTTGQIFRVGRDGRGLAQLTRFDGVAHDLDAGADGSVAFVYETVTSPAELHVWNVDQTKAQPRILTAHNREFLDRSLGETRLIRWKNPEDDLEIEGLLTLPLGYRDGDRVPLITFVHGGPASHFDQRFVGYLGALYPVHSFAAKGFAVLRPNPRGTGSYRESFRRANQADWGGMDYIDIQAGIDGLVEQGIADPERLGMMGWSYGGYMTAWTITRTERFRAVSIGAPVVDLLSFHGTTDIPGFIPSYFGSTPWANPELHRARSPMWQVSRAKTPALIQHGSEDDRVPLSQGQMLHRALEELDVPVVMVVYPRTPHTPQEPLLRIDTARRNLWWFEKWLMGRDVTYEVWLEESRLDADE